LSGTVDALSGGVDALAEKLDTVLGTLKKQQDVSGGGVGAAAGGSGEEVQD
jgi:hypothetical protein